MKNNTLLIICCLFIVSLNTMAQFNIASDKADNYSSWANNSNSGYGFDNWNLWNTGTSGWFLGSSTTSGFGDVDTNSKAFGLWGNPSGSNYANAQRTFTNWSDGATFSIDIATAYRSGAKGISLLATGYEEIWNFNIGGDKYTAGAVDQSWVYSQTSVFTLTATQSGADVLINLVRGSDTYTTTISGKTLYGFKLYCGSTNAGSDLNNLFFNNLKISYIDWSEIPADKKVEITADATLGANKSVSELIIFSGATVELSAAKQLTVTGALTNNGTLNLLSTAAGTATLLATGTVTDNGTTNVSQYLKDARNWYVASPVSGATLPASGYTLYERNEANVSWPTPTGTFTQGKGYIAFPDVAASTLTFSGTLNLANVNAALTWAGTSSKGFNLIGNPYPSHLTWTQEFVEANNLLIEPSIYYRTNSGVSNNNGLWSTPTYNALSEASVGGATAIIPPMQAVWVRAIAAGTLTLDNSQLTRSHQTSNPLKAPAVQASQKLRLVVTDGQANDEMLVYFNANASNAYDRYDSPKMMNGTNSTIPDMFTLADNEQLVINGMSTIPTEIPLYFKANASTANEFSLSATEISNFEFGTKVYIKNNKTGFEQLISDGATYSFDGTSNPSLSILIKAPGVISGFESNNSSNFNVYANAVGQITVDNSTLKGSDIVAVYNSVGQRVMSQTLSNTHCVLNKTFTAGVYVVKVNEVSHKVIVK